MKEQITKKISDIEKDLVSLSLAIHQNPELGFKEYEAAKLLAGFLKNHGFTVEEGIGGLPTAFRAYIDFGGGPTVAYLAEYDALPEIGHACGHNLIAIMSVGAAVGLAAVKPAGRVMVLGTPAEEMLGGKINLIDAGVFEDVDYALMIHPSGANLVNRTSTALTQWTITMKGQNAHSSNPQNGISALNAIIQTFNNIDFLRALMPNSANVHGIITEGGKAANIIPDKAAAEITTRAKNLKELEITNSYVERAVHAAEVLVGAKAAIVKDPSYADMLSSRPISAAFKANMAALGITMKDADNDGKFGSSDIGNVSHVVPSIHPYLDIGANAHAHTIEFTEASASNRAHDAAIKGAMGLAMTGFDILSDGVLREDIKKAFENDKEF